MNSTIYFSACSLFYCILLAIIVFFDKRFKDSKIFKTMLIMNFIGLLLEVAGLFLGSNYETYNVLNNVVLKMMLVYYVSWVSFFVMYVIGISYDKKIGSAKQRSFALIYIIILLLDLFIPMYSKINNGVILYTYGPGINLIYYYSLICDVLCLMIMFKNFKKVKTTLYAPLFVLISAGTIVSMIQSSYPSLMLSSTMQTFVMYIMHFTGKSGMEKEAVKKIEKDEK